MGQSTDAILVWGFDLGDREGLDEEVQNRIEHWNDDGYDEVTALEKSTGAELVSHCSCDCPHYIIGVTKTKTRAWRGHPQEIESLDLDVAEGQAALGAFAKALGVDTKVGRWILASDWC